MVFRTCLIAGFVMLGTSVLIIPYGTHLQTQSPRFEEYRQQTIRDIIAQNPGQDLAPGIGIGLALSSAWQFVACLWVFIILWFTSGVLVIQILARWNRTLTILVAVGFGLVCLWGAFLALGTALDCFQWGFLVQGTGYMLSGLGLGIGALGSVMAESARPRPTR